MSVAPRRLTGAVAAAAVATGVLAGCGAAGRTLSQRSLEVIFIDPHTTADVARVRARCNGVGGAVASAPGKDNAMNRRYPLRFDISGLSVPARSKLVVCLAADKSVQAYQDSESTN